jgi:hypothetical protein
MIFGGMCLFENYIWLAPTRGDNAIITSHPKITALIVFAYTDGRGRPLH